MFVFKKGRLLRKVEPLSNDEVVYKLYHPTTKMEIAINVNTDFEDMEGREPFKIDPKDEGVNIAKANMTSPYRVYKEEDGQYVIYKEFWDKKKTLVENFLDAIYFFEEKIYEILNEKPPAPDPPIDDSPPPETFLELPQVNDVVKIGNKHGLVLDVDTNDRNIKIKEVTQTEALDTLKKRKQAQEQTT
jgi:hypothetical protein